MKWITLGFRLTYAAVFAPLFAFLVGRYPGLHRRLVGPLLVGPFRGELVEKIWQEIYLLEKGGVSNEEFARAITARMCSAVSSGQLDGWLKMGVGGGNRDLLLVKSVGYTPFKRWYLKLHFMEQGNKHGLHAHHDVISTQVIARGKLHVKEFDLLGGIKNNSIRIKKRRDGVVEAVNGFITTAHECNVHGFEPVDGAAVRFQFYLRGQSGFMAGLFPKRGRLYVRPCSDSMVGDVVFARIGDSKQAN